MKYGVFGFDLWWTPCDCSGLAFCDPIYNSGFLTNPSVDPTTGFAIPIPQAALDYTAIYPGALDIDYGSSSTHCKSCDNDYLNAEGNNKVHQAYLMEASQHPHQDVVNGITQGTIIIDIKYPFPTTIVPFPNTIELEADVNGLVGPYVPYGTTADPRPPKIDWEEDQAAGGYATSIGIADSGQINLDPGSAGFNVIEYGDAAGVMEGKAFAIGPDFVASDFQEALGGQVGTQLNNVDFTLSIKGTNCSFDYTALNTMTPVVFPIYGCVIKVDAVNYDILANVDDGSCLTHVPDARLRAFLDVNNPNRVTCIGGVRSDNNAACTAYRFNELDVTFGVTQTMRVDAGLANSGATVGGAEYCLTSDLESITYLYFGANSLGGQNGYHSQDSWYSYFPGGDRIEDLTGLEDMINLNQLALPKHVYIGDLNIGDPGQPGYDECWNTDSNWGWAGNLTRLQVGGGVLHNNGVYHGLETTFLPSETMNNLWGLNQTGSSMTELRIDETNIGLQASGFSITALTSLKELYAQNAQFSTINLSGNTALEQLYISYNRLTSLALPPGTNLLIVHAAYNHLWTLDTSTQTNLFELVLTGNNDKSYEYSGHTYGIAGGGISTGWERYPSTQGATGHSDHDSFNYYQWTADQYLETNKPSTSSPTNQQWDIGYSPGITTVGPPVTAGSFLTMGKYKIKTLGTTTQAEWNTTAGTSGLTYSVDDYFVAKVDAGNGNGTVYQMMDLTNNVKLWHLNLKLNGLVDINISTLVDLGKLNLVNNNLRQIDFSTNIDIWSLQLTFNYITSLSTSQMPNSPTTAFMPTGTSRSTNYSPAVTTIPSEFRPSSFDHHSSTLEIGGNPHLNGTLDLTQIPLTSYFWLYGNAALDNVVLTNCNPTLFDAKKCTSLNNIDFSTVGVNTLKHIYLYGSTSMTSIVLTSQQELLALLVYDMDSLSTLNIKNGKNSILSGWHGRSSCSSLTGLAAYSNTSLSTINVDDASTGGYADLNYLDSNDVAASSISFNCTHFAYTNVSVDTSITFTSI